MRIDVGCGPMSCALFDFSFLGMACPFKRARPEGLRSLLVPFHLSIIPYKSQFLLRIIPTPDTRMCIYILL